MIFAFELVAAKQNHIVVVKVLMTAFAYRHFAESPF